MRHIDPSTEIKDRILLLEHRHAAELNLLKAQIKQSAETLKPGNFIKGAFLDSSHAPGIVNKIVDAALGLMAGYVAKKIATGDTKIMLKKLFGLLVQVVVTNSIVRNSDKIKSAGKRMVREMMHKKSSMSSNGIP